MAKKKRRPSKPVRLVRAERALRDREAIRVLREHVNGFNARDGYSLDPRKIEQMPAHRRRSLRKKYTELATRLARPHVLVKAKDKREAKALRRETGQLWHDAKHFVVQVPDAQRSTVKVTKAGRVSIRTKLPKRAAYDETLFRWPKRPKSPDDMLDMLEEMELPEEGSFYLQTSRYGDIEAEAMDKPALVRMLRTYLRRYDKEEYGVHRFLNQVIGFRWVRSELEGKVIRQRRGEAREAQRELNEQRRLELETEARKVAHRLCIHGRKVGTPCKRCPKGVAREPEKT